MLPIIAAALFTLFVVYIWFHRHNPTYPPCPLQPWPIIGHLHMLKTCPREQFKEFRKQCGDIYSLYLGTTHVVMLNGISAVKEAFVKQADDFSDRADIFLDTAFGSTNKGIANANGQIWREQRSLTLTILKEFGVGKNTLADKIHEEISNYIELVDSLKGEAADMHSHSMVTASNIICSIIIGKRFDYKDENFVQMVRLLSYNLAHLKGTTVLNYFPWLRFLPGDVFKFKIIQRNFQEFLGIFANFYIKENEQVSGVPTNFIAAYIQKMTTKKLTEEATHLDKQNLLRCIFDIFAAGTETIASTISWFFLYMIHYQHVQEKLYREVESVVGLDRAPTMQDKIKLNYLNAVIMEVQRLASVAPLSLPRKVSKDITFRGYIIPKGANIIANMDSILHDKAVWGEDAEEFRPERFIGEDGNIIYSESWIPFSFGRRVCLGEGLSKMELFLFVSTVVQKFQILPADSNNIQPIKGNYGISHTPDHFEGKLVRRKSD